MSTDHPADRIIMHADMDCFFAAVEEREDPKLKGKPVIVGSDPQEGRGRGIVATANYEARRFGVGSAMPISIAYRKCPHGVYLRPRFKLYSAASKRIMAVLEREADVFEPAGVDEAYLDVSSRATFEAARELAARLQEEIRDCERLTVSIGAGPNKLIAKLASDHKKPKGITVVIPERVLEFLDPKPVRALRGVGPKTAEHLEKMGYRTVRELRAASETALTRAFGRFGAFLWREARGRDDRPVDPDWEAKSFGRETTFSSDTHDAELVRTTLVKCVRRVQKDMSEEGVWARRLAVKIRYEGFETHSKQMTLRQPTGSARDMEKAALALIGPFLMASKSVRLVGFTASKPAPPEDLLPLSENN